MTLFNIIYLIGHCLQTAIVDIMLKIMRVICTPMERCHLYTPCLAIRQKDYYIVPTRYSYTIRSASRKSPDTLAGLTYTMLPFEYPLTDALIFR